MSENNKQIFTLTFDTVDGEGVFDTVTGEAGSYYQLPERIPVKAGYRFGGWRNCTDVIFEKGGDYWFNYADDTLVAVWEPIEITLSFDTNGGDEYAPIIGLETHHITLFAPIKAGYSFSRWVNSSGISFNAGDEYFFNYGNDTLTAVWGATISYNLGEEGEGNFPTEFYEVNVMTAPPEYTPTRTGYNFVKWTSEHYGDLLPGEIYMPSHGDDTLTAVWEIIYYTLTFETGDGTDISSVTMPYNYQHVLEEIPTNGDYTFVRWVSSSGYVYLPESTYTFINGNDTLTAVWGYTVTLDYCNGETGIVKGGVGETLDVVPTKEGYTFMGWQRPDGSLCNPYTFDYGHEQLYAMWGFSITYDTKNGNESLPAQVVLPGAMFTIPETIPTKNGYYFEFWTTTPQDPRSSTWYYPGNTLYCHENVTLYAVWGSGVMFDANGGSCDGFVYTGLDTDTCGIPDATHEGYTLVKWVNSQGVEFEPNGTYPFIYGNDTLTAVWGCVISLDVSGGDNDIESITAFHNETITLPIPTREGYDFICWRSENGINYNDTFHVFYGSDTLTAVWELKTYSISYDVEGFANQTKEYFSDITLHPNVPERDGYTFLNWETGNGTYYDAGEEYTINNDLSLSAVWVADGQTVITYDLNGGTGSFLKQTKEQNESITLHTEEPVLESMGFYCWIDQNGNTYEKSAVYSGSESLKLSAYWKPEYTITYLDGKSRVGKTQCKLEGVNVNLLRYIPTKEGYEFVYWIAIDADGTYEPGDEFYLNCNVTLKPVWIRLFDIIYKNGNSFIYYDEKCRGESYTVEDIMVENGTCEFVFWKVKDRNEYYYPGEKLTVYETVILEAVWVETNKVAIAFDVGDADREFEMQTVDKNSSITISSEIPSKGNCIFKGWEKIPIPENTLSIYNMSRTTENQSQTVYKEGDEYVASESTVFRALFEEGVKITSKPYNNSISLNEISHQLTFALDPTMYGADIQWTSSNFKVASITIDGIVNLKTPGQTTITVTATVENGTDTPDVCTDSFVLTVFHSDPNHVNFKIINKPYDGSTVLGHTTNLSVETDFSFEAIKWESQDPLVATVSPDGVMTPISEGETLISASITVGSYDNAVEYIDSFVVTVTDDIFYNVGGNFGDKSVKSKAISKMKEYYNSKPELKQWIDGDNTCIFAFEGLGDPSLKELDTVPTNRTNTSEIHPVWLYNAMMVVTKGRKIVYVTRRASTLPDLRPGSGRATTIKNGVYEYCTGNHGWAWENGKQVIGESTYIGLVPTDDPRVAWYVRGNEFVDDDSNGTNLHAGTALFHGNTVYYNSEGCQIVHFKDYISLGKAVGFLKNDSVLEDVTSAPSLGTTMHNTIGAVGGDKDYSQSVKVKYILNRDYDNQNPYKGDSIYADKNYGDNSSKYPDGVFYPL